FSAELPAVYILGSDGVDYHPRMVSYDSALNQATFLMLDALPNGAAELHVSNSGPSSVTDLAGNPLVGNIDPAADFVIHFSVNGPDRGSDGNPLLWESAPPNDDTPQDLGVLFPHELEAGVVVERMAGAEVADAIDQFSFQVLQSRDYFTSLL